MSGLGNLSQCMVDSDGAAKTRAKRLRRKALAASVALEALLVAGVMLWPLVTLGVLPAQVVVTPLPPFRGAPESRPVAQQPPHVTSGHTVTMRPDSPPPRLPSHSGASLDAAPPSLGPEEPMGPGIANGFPEGRPIEIERPQPLAQPNRPVVRNAEVMAAMLVHRVEPDYPRLAITIHLAGQVVLRARIGTDGEVHELETLSGNTLLAQAARAAVLQWRYQPTMLHGQAVEVETQITVNFVLNAE